MTSAKTPIRVCSQVLAGRAFQGLRGWQRPHRVWGPPAGVLAAVPHGPSRFRGCRRPHPAPTAGSPVSSPPETHAWSEAGGHDAPGDRGRASPPSGRGPHHSDPGAVRVRGEDTGGPWMSSVCPFPLGGGSLSGAKRSGSHSPLRRILPRTAPSPLCCGGDNLSSAPRSHLPRTWASANPAVDGT